MRSEVADVLKEKGYKVLVEDYDFRPGASFVEAMHEASRTRATSSSCYTADYEASPYTRKEFTSFEAERWRKAPRSGTSSSCAVRTCRCADCLSDMSIRTSWASHDPQERKRRIIAAAERQSQAAPPPPRPFIGVPPRIASFTGRADELDRLDAILMQDKPAAVTQAS